MTGLVTLFSACQGFRWGTVIWAGLGYGAGLAGVRALNAECYIYLEPNAALRSRLLQKYQFSGRERLVDKALWSCADTRLFHVLSDPLRSSLVAPDRVLKAWPNLRQVDEYEVETESIASLLAEYATPAAGSNLLVLDVCGAEYEVLTAADAALLARFNHIIIHRDVAETGKEDADWRQLLTGQGYLLHDPVDIQSGGWLLLHRPQDAAEPQLPATAETAPPVETPEAAQPHEMEAELERVRGENAELCLTLQVRNAAAAETQEALAQARQATSLSLKLQTLRENDLRVLQQRYRASLQVQERQHQMLVQLGERLGEASRYFQQLTDASGGGTGDGTGSARRDPVVIGHGMPADPWREVAADDQQARPHHAEGKRDKKTGCKAERNGDARATTGMPHAGGVQAADEPDR